MAKVSVIVPVYNVEKYLKECLDSIQNQTLQDIEIICVDDGSTDSSVQILDEYAEKDCRFQIIHKQNEGYGKSMNLGINMATSPYIGIVESDDKIELNMYETLYKLIENKKVDVVKADYYEFYDGGKGKPIERYISSISEARLRRYKPLKQERVDKLVGLYDVVFSIKEYEEAFLFEKYTWSGLYNRKFLQENYIMHNETPGASYQDNGFWFQTMIKAKTIYFTKQAFYHYRIDNLNSSIHSKAKVFAVCDEYDFICNVISKMGKEGNRYYKWASYFKIIDCIDNITRVSDEFKEALANRIKEEFLLAVSKGNIDTSLYADHWKVCLFDLFIDPNNYVKREKRRIKKIDDAISSYDDIIIYGAGILGQRMHGMLIEGRRNIKVKYFAVTELNGNPDELFGIPVKKIDELQEYKNKALVIVSVGKKYIQEVVNCLESQHFCHYILMDDIQR